MERLLINQGRYHGECIDIDQTLRQIDSAALKNGWKPVPIQLNQDRKLPAYHRASSATSKEIYISSGIHGDEPAGPLAALRLIAENQWPADTSIWLAPCLNPAGFVLNCREDGAGIDLNRDYRALKTEAIRAHIAWLSQRPFFDLTLLLHEDWEANGFYLYELNSDSVHSVATSILNHVKTVCPVDTSPLIEGRPATNGLIAPHINMDERPDWPEAFYLSRNKTRLNYTLEAPSDFLLPVRVNALVAGVQGALSGLSG
jgi:murein peptide amidase A